MSDIGISGGPGGIRPQHGQIGGGGESQKSGQALVDGKVHNVQRTDAGDTQSMMAQAKDTVPGMPQQIQAPIEGQKPAASGKAEGADSSEGTDDTEDTKKKEKAGVSDEVKDMRERKVSDVDPKQQKKREGFWARLMQAKLVEQMQKFAAMGDTDTGKGGIQRIGGFQDLIEISMTDEAGNPLPDDLINTDPTDQYENMTYAASRADFLADAISATGGDESKIADFIESKSQDELDKIFPEGSNDDHIASLKEEMSQFLEPFLSNENVSGLSGGDLAKATSTAVEKGLGKLREFSTSIHSMGAQAIGDLEFGGQVKAGYLFGKGTDTAEYYREIVIKNAVEGKTSAIFGSIIDKAEKMTGSGTSDSAPAA